MNSWKSINLRKIDISVMSLTCSQSLAYFNLLYSIKKIKKNTSLIFIRLFEPSAINGNICKPTCAVANLPVDKITCKSQGTECEYTWSLQNQNRKQSHGFKVALFCWPCHTGFRFLLPDRLFHI